MTPNLIRREQSGGYAELRLQRHRLRLRRHEGAGTGTERRGRPHPERALRVPRNSTRWCRPITASIGRTAWKAPSSARSFQPRVPRTRRDMEDKIRARIREPRYRCGHPPDSATSTGRRRGGDFVTTPSTEFYSTSARTGADRGARRTGARGCATSTSSGDSTSPTAISTSSMPGSTTASRRPRRQRRHAGERRGVSSRRTVGATTISKLTSPSVDVSWQPAPTTSAVRFYSYSRRVHNIRRASSPTPACIGSYYYFFSDGSSADQRNRRAAPAPPGRDDARRDAAVCSAANCEVAVRNGLGTPVRSFQSAGPGTSSQKDRNTVAVLGFHYELRPGHDRRRIHPFDGPHEDRLRVQPRGAGSERRAGGARRATGGAISSFARTSSTRTPSCRSPSGCPCAALRYAGCEDPRLALRRRAAPIRCPPTTAPTSTSVRRTTRCTCSERYSGASCDICQARQDVPPRSHRRADLVDARGDGPVPAGGLRPRCGRRQTASSRSRCASRATESGATAAAPPGAPPFPTLDGQHAAYLNKQLREFMSGKRKNDLMAPLIASLKKNQMLRPGRPFRRPEPRRRAPSANPQLAATGQGVYEEGNHATGVPACVGCHLPDGVGNQRYPRLAGQRQAYVVQQLTNFKSGARTNDRAGVMRAVAGRLTDQEMRAVAEDVAGLR